MFGGPPRYCAEFLRLKAGSFTLKACSPYSVLVRLRGFEPPLHGF